MAWPKGMKRGRDLRPVATPELPGVVKAAEVEAMDITQETPAPVVKTQSKYLPYAGKDSLPPYTTVKGRVVPGEARYALARGAGKRYKLLCYRRTPAGVERIATRTITNSGADKNLFDALKKAGIPGAF